MLRPVKLAALLFAGIVWNSCMHGQITRQPAQQDTLYATALQTSLAEMQKEWGSINVAGEERIQTNYRAMPVRQNEEITHNLPTTFGQYQVEYLDDQALIERYKKLQKSFAVLEIHPMHNNGSQLRIQITVSWVLYEKQTIMFALSDWSDVEFKYDCAKQDFTVSAVKLGGI